MNTPAIYRVVIEVVVTTEFIIHIPLPKENISGIYCIFCGM